MAVLWGLGGLGGIVYAVIVIRRMRVQAAYQPEFEDWLFHVLLPIAAYVTLAVSGCAAPSHMHEALFGAGAAALLLLFIGIHNAWDAVTYHVFVKNRHKAKAGSMAEFLTPATVARNLRATLSHMGFGKELPESLLNLSRPVQRCHELLPLLLIQNESGLVSERFLGLLAGCAQIPSITKMAAGGSQSLSKPAHGLRSPRAGLLQSLIQTRCFSSQ